MVKKAFQTKKLSRTSMEHRFDYLLRSVLSEIETQELRKVSTEKASKEFATAEKDPVLFNETL